MSNNICIFLLDNSSNIIEEIAIKKPITYQQLLIAIKTKIKQLPQNFYIFSYHSNNKQIIINNNEKYKLSNNILFISQNQKDGLNSSIYSEIYNKLSDKEKEILDEKFNCFICDENIKEEKPLFCYICQKIFHNKCLEKWDKNRKAQNENLSCPNCRTKLPLEQWKQKIDFEDSRLYAAETLIKLNKYNNYIEKTCILFKEILKKLNIINSLINSKINHKLIDLINVLSFKVNDPPINNISNIILEELNILEIYIKNINRLNINLNKEKEKSLNEKNDINKKIIQYKNEIELIYVTSFKGDQTIFGKDFVNINKYNIELIINGKKSDLVHSYNLKYGKNIIKLIIKNKLTNLKGMFCGCKSLKNIEQLQYLDVKEVNNLSDIFDGCTFLSDINPLQYWDVSNCEVFSNMFSKCSSLINIIPIQNWDVSKAVSLAGMFSKCSALSNIKPLQNWNVLKCKNFSYMFDGCKILSNIFPLENWNILKGEQFLFIFDECPLINIEQIKKWILINDKFKYYYDKYK